jgi:hypothetical protein
MALRNHHYGMAVHNHKLTMRGEVRYEAYLVRYKRGISVGNNLLRPYRDLTVALHTCNYGLTHSHNYEAHVTNVSGTCVINRGHS